MPHAVTYGNILGPDLTLDAMVAEAKRHVLLVKVSCQLPPRVLLSCFFFYFGFLCFCLSPSTMLPLLADASSTIACGKPKVANVNWITTASSVWREIHSSIYRFV